MNSKKKKKNLKMWLQMCHSKRKSKKALYFVTVARASFLFSFSFFGLGMFNSPCTQVKQDSDDGCCPLR
jgi:hypothetical protein